MLRATLLMIVLLPGVPAWLAAQPAPGPEVFTGTANAKNANASASAKLVVQLRRVTPEFDRKSVETALKEGGYPRFLTAIRNAPEVGQVTLGNGKPYSIRYARERAADGGRVLILVTDRPVYFIGGGRAEAQTPTGFQVAVIEMRLNASGAGSGSMAAAARVRPDGDGGVLLDDFADELISVTGITRTP